MHGAALEEQRGPLGLLEDLDVPDEEAQADGHLEDPKVQWQKRVGSGPGLADEEGTLAKVGEEEDVQRQRDRGQLAVVEAGVCPKQRCA